VTQLNCKASQAAVIFGSAHAVLGGGITIGVRIAASSKNATSLLHTRLDREQENRTPPSNVRSPDYQSGRRSTGADSLHTPPRYSRSCNLQCRSSVRRSLFPLAHSRSSLPPSSAASSTTDTKPKRKLRCAAGAADARLATGKSLPTKFFLRQGMYSSL